MSIGHIKRVSLWMAFAMVFSASSGCGIYKIMAERDFYYRFEPSVLDRACRNDKDTGKTTAGKKEGELKEGCKITDQHILAFTGAVKYALRTRMDWARIARYVSGTMQVLSAAAAATLTATSGSANAITALAGFAAVAPELQGIFDARERARAYDDGLSLIEDAEGRYFTALVPQRGVVSGNELTEDGVLLYSAVLASIKLIEKAMVNQIPTIKDLETAAGKFSGLKLSATSVVLTTTHHLCGSTTPTPTAETEILITRNGPGRKVSSDKPSIATASLVDANRSIKITGHSVGNANITVVNEANEEVTIKVTVEP